MKKNNVIVSLIVVLILSLCMGIFTACEGNVNPGDSSSEASITSTGGNNSAQDSDSSNTSGSDSTEHTHTFADTWSSDDTHHWYACTGADCTETKDKAEHAWDEGVVTKEAMADVKGEKTFTCTICNKTKIEEFDYVAPVAPAVKTDGYYVFESCTAQGDTDVLGDETEMYTQMGQNTYLQFGSDGSFTYALPTSNIVYYGTYLQNIETGVITVSLTKAVVNGVEHTAPDEAQTLDCTIEDGKIVLNMGGSSNGTHTVAYYGTFKFAKELPLVPSDTVDIVLDADDLGTFTAEKVLGYNVKLVATEGKNVVIDANNKSLDGIDFTHRIKLNGTIDSTARYIEIIVEKPSVIKVYAMSGSSSKEGASFSFVKSV